MPSYLYPIISHYFPLSHYSIAHYLAVDWANSWLELPVSPSLLVKSPFAGKSPCDIPINWANSGLDLFNILYYLSIPFYTSLYLSIPLYTFLYIHFYTFLYLSIPLYPTKVPGSNLPASTQQALVASPQAHAPQRPSLWPRLRWRKHVRRICGWFEKLGYSKPQKNRNMMNNCSEAAETNCALPLLGEWDVPHVLHLFRGCRTPEIRR